jgi:hypothetical protein
MAKKQPKAGSGGTRKYGRNRKKCERYRAKVGKPHGPGKGGGKPHGRPRKANGLRQGGMPWVDAPKGDVFRYY